MNRTCPLLPALAAVAMILPAGCSAPMPELLGVTTQQGAGERFAVELTLRDAEDDQEVVRLLVDPANFGSSPHDRVTLAVGPPRDDDGDGAPVILVAYGRRVAWRVEVPADIEEGLSVLPARRVHVRADVNPTHAPATGWVLVRETGRAAGGQAELLSEVVELKPAEGERWLQGEEVSLPPPQRPR